MKLMSKDNKNTIALLVYIFYPELVDEIIEHVHRVPFSCDVYVATPSHTALEKIKKALSHKHTIIPCEYVDAGMDMGPFFHQLEKIHTSNRKYTYYLKIHSKKKDEWRKEMLEACLPKEGYENIFSILDEQHMIGSEKYLFPFSYATRNSDLILSQIQKHGLQTTEDDLYDTVDDFDPEKVYFDPDFYANYHCDLKMRYNASKQEGLDPKEVMINHWEEEGKGQIRRVPNSTLVQSKAKRKYKFFAGSVFWFDDMYLKFLLKHMDSFEEIDKNLKKEKGGFINKDTTYTHHLEYWLGLLASHMNYPRELKGITGKESGLSEKRRRNANLISKERFDWKRYIQMRPDLQSKWNGPVRAFVHYLLFGKRELTKSKQLNIALVRKEDTKRIKEWRSRVLQNKCLYIHIPKCAGTSIENILYGKPLIRFDIENKLWIQHATVKELVEYYFSEEELESLFTFAIVRNPFDRFVSSYNWLCSVEGVPKTKETFRDFVFVRNEFEFLIGEKYRYEKRNYYHHLLPQIEFLEKDGDVVVDYVGRFENLQEDWNKISQKIRIDTILPYLNKEKHDHYSSYFDEETRAVVEERYKRDLEYFGYEYEDVANSQNKKQSL